MTIDVARIRSLFETRESHLATIRAAKDAQLAEAERGREAKERLEAVESTLNGLLPDALPRLVEAAELLAELLPHIAPPATHEIHMSLECDCARCRARALVGA